MFSPAILKLMPFYCDKLVTATVSCNDSDSVISVEKLLASFSIKRKAAARLVEDLQSSFIDEFVQFTDRLIAYNNTLKTNENDRSQE